MEILKRVFEEKYVVWFTAVICVFHFVLGLIHYFIPVKELYPLDYALILIALTAWIIHLIAFGVKLRPGSAFIILSVMFFWYLISCQVMTDTYYRSWFSYNKDPLYDTLFLFGLVFPLGIYMGRKGFDKFVRILIHTVVFAWTGFMIFVLINVFQNRIINMPSGGQIGMSAAIALCLNTHYNTTGVIELVMQLIVLYFIFNSRSHVVRILYILPCLVHWIGLVMANSRTSFLAAVIFTAACVFSAVFNAKREISLPKRILIGAAAAGATAVLLLLFRELVFYVHESITHLRELIYGTYIDSSARDLTSTLTIQSRFKIWRASLKAMGNSAQQSLFGVTPVSVVSAVAEAGGDSIEKNVYTHNQFLEVGVALGIPGMLLFILFVALLAKNSFLIAIKQNEGLKAWVSVSIVVTLLIANLLEATLMFYRFISSYPFFLFSGWICGVADLRFGKSRLSIIRKSSRKKEPSAAVTKGTKRKNSGKTL